MKIKIYSLAVDAPQSGTGGGAYATEKAAYKALIENLDVANAETANLLEAENFIELDDYLQAVIDGDRATWSIDECDIEVPIVDELVGALENAVVIVAHTANEQRRTEVDVAQAKAALPLVYAALAKAKAVTP